LVKGNSTVVAELALTVPQRTAEGIKDIAQRYLGQGWSVRILEGKGEQRTVYAWRAVRAQPEAKLMPGVTVQVRRRPHWLRATYEVSLRYDPTELLQTQEERRLATNQQVTVRVRLPGRVIAERSSVAPADGNWVELTLDPLQPYTVRLTAIGVLWWRVALVVLLLAALLWFLAPYVPHILDRLSRRTVRVVQR
jgi:hypothetical protein